MAGMQHGVSQVRMQAAGEFHVAERLVVFVAMFEDEVAEHRVGNPCLHALDRVVGRDGAVHPVLPKRRDRNDCHVRAIVEVAVDVRAERRRVGVRRHGGLEEAVRREPDLELPDFRSAGCHRRRVGPLHVPAVVAAVERDELLFALNHLAASWIVPLPAGELLARGLGVVIDGPGVRRHLEPRPIICRAVTLAHPGDPAFPGNLDGLQVVGAHVLGRRLQDRFDILGGRRPGHERQQYKKDGRYFLCHIHPHWCHG